MKWKLADYSNTASPRYHFFVALLEERKSLSISFSKWLVKAWLTKWMIPAAVSHTDMKMEISWANRMDVDVLRIFRYCKMSGTVIKRRALKNLKPATGSDRQLGKRSRYSCSTYKCHWCLYHSLECNKHIIRSTLVGNESTFRWMHLASHKEKSSKKTFVHAYHWSINTRNSFLLFFAFLEIKEYCILRTFGWDERGMHCSVVLSH